MEIDRQHWPRDEQCIVLLWKCESMKGDWSIKIMELVLKLHRGKKWVVLEGIVISPLFLLMVKLSFVSISRTWMKRTVVPQHGLPTLGAERALWLHQHSWNLEEQHTVTWNMMAWAPCTAGRVFWDGESKYPSPGSVKQRGQHKRRHNARGGCRRQRAGLGGSEDEG